MNNFSEGRRPSVQIERRSKSGLIAKQIQVNLQEHMENPKITISLFQNSFATKPSKIDSVDFLNRMKTDQWRSQVEKVQRLYKNGGKSAAKKTKERLPAVTWSGTFTKRCNGGLYEYSGLLVADLDELGEKLGSTRQLLMMSPHLYAVFKSPTGSGLKAVFRVPNNPQLHGRSFKAVTNYVRQLTGVDIDQRGGEICRLCYVSYDPDCFLNLDAKELPLPASNSEAKSDYNPPSRTDAQTHRTLRVPDEQTPRPSDAQTFNDKQTNRSSTPSSPTFSLGPKWIDDFIPCAGSTNNGLLFSMARGTIGLERELGRPFTPAELAKVLDAWYDRSNPAFLTSPREEYFAEFCRLRSYAKVALGDSPVSRAMRNAKAMAIPVECLALPEEVGRFACVCAEMQRMVGDVPFFLSSHDTDTAFGKSSGTTYKWIRTLMGLRILERVECGSFVKGRASEFGYLGSLPDQPTGLTAHGENVPEATNKSNNAKEARP